MQIFSFRKIDDAYTGFFYCLIMIVASMGHNRNCRTATRDTIFQQTTLLSAPAKRPCGCGQAWLIAYHARHAI